MNSVKALMISLSALIIYLLVSMRHSCSVYNATQRSRYCGTRIQKGKMTA